MKKEPAIKIEDAVTIKKMVLAQEQLTEAQQQMLEYLQRKCQNIAMNIQVLRFEYDHYMQELLELGKKLRGEGKI